MKKSKNHIDHSPDRQHRSGPESGPDGTLVPGLKPVLEILRAEPQRVDTVFLRKGRKDRHTDEVLDLCREHGARFKLVEEAALQRLYPGPCQGVLARLNSASFVEVEELLEAAPAAPLPLVLALDQVQDPGNAGTLARTLYALGGAGLLLPRHDSVYLGGAAVKASAGALSRLPVARAANLAQALDKAREAGFAVYGASAAPGSRSVYGFRPVFPAVLVLGGEEKGLRRIIEGRCDALLSIPMRRDFDSLNVAQAGAILLGFLCRGEQDSGLPHG